LPAAVMGLVTAITLFPAAGFLESAPTCTAEGSTC
jgi:hypothetical protein